MDYKKAFVKGQVKYETHDGYDGKILVGKEVIPKRGCK